MDYNTARTQLILPEYGRNIQKMVDQAMDIQDREERNRAARSIIAVLANMHPQIKEVIDYKQKLWDQLALMSNYKLDIDYPSPPIRKEDLDKSPNKIPYNNNRIRYRHYGRISENLIQRAVEMEEGEEKDALIKLIANHMKKQYYAWNRESVSDDLIFSDINELSKGKLNPEGKFKLIENRDLASSKPLQQTSMNFKKKKKQKRK